MTLSASRRGETRRSAGPVPPDPLGLCIVEVGPHPAPYWRRADDDVIFCTRHKEQMDRYNEDELGHEPTVWTPVPTCPGCRRTVRPAGDDAWQCTTCERLWPVGYLETGGT